MLRYAIITAILFTTVFSFITIPAFADEQRYNLDSTIMNDFSIVDNSGWIVGNQGVLFYTDDILFYDQGEADNWEFIPIEIDSTTINSKLNNVHFFDLENGIISGDAFAGNLLTTDNGGNTWTVSTDSLVDGEDIVDIYFIDNIGWVLGDDDHISWTIDSGDSWNKVKVSDSVKKLNSIFFIDESYGWIGGEQGTIFYSEDGGKTWVDGDCSNCDNISGIFFTSRTNGFMIDLDGNIHRSDNGGKTWNIDNSDSNTFESLHDIFFVDGTNGWIMGNNGIYLTTDNGGITWTLIESDTWYNQKSDEDYDLINVFFTDAYNGFILDEQGFTIITLDSSVAPNDSTNDGTKKRSGGGCNDCTPPTLGLDKNSKRLVDNGFTYNGNPTQVGKYHTPYPLINATVGEMNLVSIKAYENGGIYNIKRVQFGLGAVEIGTPLNSLEVLINVELLTDGTTTGVQVDEIIINDKDNLIDNDTVSAIAYVTTCQSTDVTPNCVNVDLYYSYREATINHVMLVNVEDKKHNAQSFYFNDGVQVLGESLNEALTYTMKNKSHSQQTDNLTLTLTRVDKVNHIWIDNNGVEYLHISEDRFDRITPTELYRCTDDYIIKSVVKRNNICQFLPLLNYEISRAENTMNAILSSSNLDTIESWDHNNKAFRQYE